MTDHSSSAAAPRAGSVHTDADAPSRRIAARAVAEGVGSFLVILAGLGATITASDTALQPTLVFGLAVIAAMIAFGYVSGGHFNPAITLGSLIGGRTTVKDAAVYIVAQIVGAVAASGLIWLVLSANPQLTDIRQFFGAASTGFGEHSPLQFPFASAFLLEVVATALLVAVFLGATSSRARRDLAPFAVGLVYAGLLTFLLPVTNGGLNPARSTASAIFAEPWALEQLWLFWAAPVVGALIAGLGYRSVATRDDSVPAADAAPELDAEAGPRSSSDPGYSAEAISGSRSTRARVAPTAPVGPAVPNTPDGDPSGPDLDHDRHGSVTQHREDRPGDDAASFFDDTPGDQKR